MKKTAVKAIVMILIVVALASLTSFMHVMQNQEVYDKQIKNFGICSVFYEKQFDSEAEAQKVLQEAKDTYIGYTKERMIDVKIENNKLTFGLLASQQRIDKVKAEKREAYEEEMKFWFSVGYMVSILDILAFALIMCGFMTILFHSDIKEQKVTYREFYQSNMIWVIGIYVGTSIGNILNCILK